MFTVLAIVVVVRAAKACIIAEHPNLERRRLHSLFLGSLNGDKRAVDRALCVATEALCLSKLSNVRRRIGAELRDRSQCAAQRTRGGLDAFLVAVMRHIHRALYDDESPSVAEKSDARDRVGGSDRNPLPG